jgi:hypothetical protein
MFRIPIQHACVSRHGFGDDNLTAHNLDAVACYRLAHLAGLLGEMDSGKTDDSVRDDKAVIAMARHPQ